jgi:hypothetical protein
MNSNSLTSTKRLASWLVLAVLAAFLIGCGGSKESAKSGEEKAQPAAEGAEGKLWQPTGEEGTIAGKVNFEGQAPKLKAISMDADSICAAKHSAPVYPEVVVANGNKTLRNVFVYVKSGLEGKSFSVPDQPVTLDQNGCIYKPHVLGIQARQNLKVVSSDNTTHNIHPMPTVNREWNVSQSPGADAIIKSFTRGEVSIPVKCNQHPWMRAYFHVVSHPFFAVTGDTGTFEIKGLPPGNYTIEAVHEQFGAMTQQVKVDPKQTAPLDFTYKATQAFRPSSLETLPAMVLPCCGK